MRQATATIGFASLAFGLVSWGLCGAAYAQEAHLQEPLAAPSRAFELQLSTGYEQGFGRIAPNSNIREVAGAGMGFAADVGYRITPWVSVDLEGQYQVYVSENASSSQGMDVNIGGTFHGNPGGRFDPWLRVASGYRWIWQHDISSAFGPVPVDTSYAYQGWDIINGRIGLDIRTSEDIALSPVIGASFQTFFWATATPNASAVVGTFVFAGVQGRFDFGGRGRTNVASAE
jgi:hypothetical protein